jgi:Cd2+/Zn2+-exporting ATPase
MACSSRCRDKHTVVVFDEFLESRQDSDSPFLTCCSKKWGINLPLRSALLAAVLWIICFSLSFFPAYVSISNLLLVLIFFIAGSRALIESIQDILTLEINIDVLMTLAAFSSVALGSGTEGALLLVLFDLSGAMEDTVTTKAVSALRSLHKLSPTKASIVMADGSVTERAVNDVKLGEKILIKAGEIVPLDGLVIDGASSVNLVHLTGENKPFTKTIGDMVPAGGRTIEGALTLEVTHTSSDSTLARIINLITQAQDAKPKLQQWFDEVSRRYAITIIFLAFTFSITFPTLLGIDFLGHGGAMYRSLAFLIAASPCALIIAVPIAYLSSLSACARKGILLKGGVILDALAGCEAIAFDKTGTLTTGELKCVGEEVLGGASGDMNQYIAVAAAMERNAVHPLARAITKFADEKKIRPAKIIEFKMVPGYGIEAKSEFFGRLLPVYIGNFEYIYPKLPTSLADQYKVRRNEIQDQGDILASMLVGDQQLILFRFHDQVRTEMKETLSILTDELGISVVMLTGDHHASAQAIARELNITEFHAELKPEDKLEYVSRLASERGLVMVGDGINDAPALARATVGIAMGGVGSATAVDASDVVLLHDELKHLDWLMRKAKQTQRVVRENLLIASAAILIAVVPALMGHLPLWLAVIVHEGGTIVVGLNGLRLLRSN